MKEIQKIEKTVVVVLSYAKYQYCSRQDAPAREQTVELMP